MINSLEGQQNFMELFCNSASVSMLKELKADSHILMLVLTAVPYTGAKEPRPPKCSQTTEQIRNRQNIHRVEDGLSVHNAGEP